MARHQHHAADPGRGRGPCRFGDAGNGERGGFRLARARFEHVDRRHVGIEQIERGKRARQQRRVGKSGEAILGRGARHGERALGQRVEAVGRNVVGGDHRLLAADENAQAHVVAFGALRFLDGAVAHIDRERYAAHGDRVGRIGAGTPRGGDQTFGEIGKGGLVEKRRHCNVGEVLWLDVGAELKTRRRCACAAHDSTENRTSARKFPDRLRTAACGGGKDGAAGFRQPPVNHAGH